MEGEQTWGVILWLFFQLGSQYLLIHEWSTALVAFFFYLNRIIINSINKDLNQVNQYFLGKVNKLKFPKISFNVSFTFWQRGGTSFKYESIRSEMWVAESCSELFFFCIKDYRYIDKDLVNNHFLYDFYLKCHLLYEIWNFKQDQDAQVYSLILLDLKYLQ